MTDSTAVTATKKPGRPSAELRARRLAALRLNSAAISVMLLVQYAIGIGVNLYAEVPDADHGAGLVAAAGRALTSQPVSLALHVALGLLLLVAGVTVLVRAIRARHRLAAAASAVGLAAMIGAAVAGAAFVNDDRDSASLTMALLTGVAMLCYLVNLLVVPARPRRDER